ncbi:MAG: hypothetical protein QW404_03865 [Candidatus Nanoarchaeia archaeon]
MDYHAVLEKPCQGSIAVVFSYGKKFISGWNKSILTRVNFSDERKLTDLVNEFNLGMSNFGVTDIVSDGEKARISYVCDDKEVLTSIFVKYFVRLSERNKCGLRIEC